MNENQNPSPSRRGFAGMDAAKQREISSKGGKAAHEKGTAHEFTTDEAREAGRKGGQRVSQDRQHMAQIGREGGRSRGAERQKRDQPVPQGGGNAPTHRTPPPAVMPPPPPERSSGQSQNF